MKKSSHTKWKHNDIKAEALKYSTRTAFKKNNYAAYQASHKQNTIDEVCLHMKISGKRFQPMKPAILYYFSITINNTQVWKIGITNYTIEDRYYRRDVDRMENITIWNFKLGSEALYQESLIKKLYKKYLYIGETPFTDGTKTTECFYCDIMDIEIDNGIMFRECDFNGEPIE